MSIHIFKRGQGKNTRLSTAIGIFVIAAAGFVRLHQVLKSYSMNPWIYSALPVILAAVSVLVIVWLSNRPTIADFLISAEGEVKKVSWSSRQEIVASTTVVICVVAIVAILTQVTDFVFGLLFREWWNINNL